MVLVDSSVWIALLRESATGVVRSLRDLLARGDAALSPLIYQEILQGAASAESFATLRRYFGSLPFLAARHPIRSHEAAADLFARCRWRGTTLRSGADCLIAQTAIEHGVRLLSDDREFKSIARIEPKLKLYE